jgi:hypothetical protein
MLKISNNIKASRREAGGNIVSYINLEQDLRMKINIYIYAYVYKLQKRKLIMNDCDRTKLKKRNISQCLMLRKSDIHEEEKKRTQKRHTHKH